ncbi:MAG: DedA family protein [Chloroflexi bacterium]|nr:DedA family protein [Chloroflexota bacterium]
MLSDLSDLLLSSLVVYGLPLIFLIVLTASAGLPLPATLVVLTAGALVQQELLSMTWVLVICLMAAVLGDHLGYMIGRWGGRPLIRRMARLIGGEASIERAVDSTQRWGWWAVFFSRWLITPLGAPCNWTCGMMDYSVYTFFLAVVIGEAIYVSAMVYLGFIFGDQLEYISQLIGALGPWLLGVVVIAVVLWLLLKPLLKPKRVPSN